MKLEVVELDNGIKQIKLKGRLDIPGTNEIETGFTVQVAAQKAAVVVDMTEVEYIASYGIRILLSNARSLAGRGGKMVLYNPIPMVKQVLTLAGIADLIPIYDDFEAACADVEAAMTD